MSAANLCRECHRPLPQAQFSAKFTPYVLHEESVGVLGVARSGKSRLVKRWLAFLMAQGVAVVVWDPKDEYSQASKRKDRSRLGPLKQRFTVPEFLAAYRKERRVLTRRDLAVSLVPSSPFLTAAERAAELLSVMKLIYARGQCVFVVEECSQLMNQQGEPLLVEIASVWPETVSSIFVGQTPTMIPTKVRSNWFRCISFVQAKSSDRNTLAADFGADFAAGLEHLGPGQCLVALSRPGWAASP